VLAHEAHQPGQGVALDRPDAIEGGEGAGVGVSADLVEEVLLGVDVVVEAPLEQPGGVGDVPRRGRLVALLVEDLGGGVEDLTPPPVELRPARARVGVARGDLSSL
jgi:hypothetical protein